MDDSSDSELQQNNLQSRGSTSTNKNEMASDSSERNTWSTVLSKSNSSLVYSDSEESNHEVNVRSK